MTKGNRNGRKQGAAAVGTIARIPEFDAAAIAAESETAVGERKGDVVETIGASAETPVAAIETKPAAVETPRAAPMVDGTLTRCKRCGSTKRAKYSNRREVEHGGKHEGRAYTHIVWRNTSCADCGQARIDRHHENRPASA